MTHRTTPVLFAVALSGLCLLSTALASGRSDEKGPDWRDLERQFRSAVASRDVATLKQLVGQMRYHDNEQAAELIIDYAITGLDFGLEMRAGATLAQMKSPEAIKAIFKAAVGHKNYKAQIVLLGVAHHRYKTAKDESAYAVLESALLDGNREVVFAALRWLREDGSTRPVDGLIRALRKWERVRRGRIYYDIRRALKEITEQDFEIADDWNNYWEARKQGLPAPPKANSGRTKVVGQKFFSVSLDSDRVAFVIDVSGSMDKKDPAPPPEPEKTERKGTFVAPRKKPEKPKPVDPKTLPIERQRLFRVKKELVALIESLPEHTHFTIQAFNHKIDFMTEALVPATAKNKEQAITWIRALKPEGETFTDTSFRELYQKIDGMDTVFFLSDGAPRRNNKPIDQEAVFREVREANRFTKCRINTIGFEQAGSNLRRFLVKLAAEHDGSYTALR